MALWSPGRPQRHVASGDGGEPAGMSGRRGPTPGRWRQIVNATAEIKNVVLVHGGFVDGSGWQGVYDHLTADGYRVWVV